MNKSSVLCAGCVCLLALTTSTSVTAAQIMWTPFDDWVEDATTGSIAYKSGSVDVAVTGGSLRTRGVVNAPFATTSAKYENIDTATHYAFQIRPDTAATPWSLEFDLVGTTLTLSSADVFTVGQLFASRTGTRSTILTIQLFAPDDVTAIDLTTIDFEQHALIPPNFDGLLDWNPATGELAPIVEPVSKNSGWGFFSPTSTEIGKIVLSATTAGNNPDTIDFGFGTVIPVPAAVWLFGSGLLGLIATASRKRA